MFLIILGLIISIALGVFLCYDFDEEGFRFRKRSLLSIPLFVICIILSMLTSVPTGYTGIVTTFGKVEDFTLDAGVHMVAPWQSVVTMDNRTQIKTLDLACFSSDLQEVNIKYTINYQIDSVNAQMIYRTVGTEYYDVIIAPKIAEACKAVFGKYNAEKLISSRAEVSKNIEDMLTSSLKDSNIHITATTIENIDFTDAFTDAVEAKQVAEQNKLKAQTQQEQAIIEAEASAKKTVLEAQAKADAAKIAAANDAEIVKIQADSAEYQGQKDAAIMDALGKKLQQYPYLIDYYKVTGWDGKLPETVLGDSVGAFINMK